MKRLVFLQIALILLLLAGTSAAASSQVKKFEIWVRSTIKFTPIIRDAQCTNIEITEDFPHWVTNINAPLVELAVSNPGEPASFSFKLQCNKNCYYSFDLKRRINPQTKTNDYGAKIVGHGCSWESTGGSSSNIVWGTPGNKSVIGGIKLMPNKPQTKK